MLFWHLGAALWLFRWIFRDPKVDVRYLLFGAVLPDLVDLPLGTVILAGRYSTGELWSHSLAAAAAYMALVLLVTRRGRRRRALMAIGVGWLFHLLLDGMWLEEEVFLWPFFGEISAGERPFWPNAWQRALADPLRWGLEVAGLVYLAALWARLGLGSEERRRQVLQTGRLPERVTDTA